MLLFPPLPLLVLAKIIIIIIVLFYFTVSRCINGDVRLVGGQSPREGRVEYCYQGEWSQICQNFQMEEAMVVCKQLGYTNPPGENLSGTNASESYVGIGRKQDGGSNGCTSNYTMINRLEAGIMHFEAIFCHFRALP